MFFVGFIYAGKTKFSFLIAFPRKTSSTLLSLKLLSESKTSSESISLHDFKSFPIRLGRIDLFLNGVGGASDVLLLLFSVIVTSVDCSSPFLLVAA